MRVLYSALGVFAVSSVLILAAAAVLAAHDPIKTRVTWTGEISRIMEARCASCHSANARGTMSLATYEEARPWARAIKEEVMTRRMPKWHAARGYGDFSNDPSLSPFEIALIAAWADGGAPRGTEADARTAVSTGTRTRSRDPADGCTRRRAPVWRAGSAGRNPARYPAHAGERRVRRRFGQASGWPAGDRGLDTRLRAGVPDNLPVAAAAGPAARSNRQRLAGGGIVQPHAHASGTVTTKDAVTTCPRR